jgi:hypothetical protein
MNDRPAYGYTSLTSATEDKASPLRDYLDRQFPCLKAVRTAYQTP